VNVQSISREAAWDCLHAVPDPEIPVISVTDLGIVRDLEIDGLHAKVTVTPTYSGCPATEMIERSIREALVDIGFKTVDVQMQLFPAWTTDWIGEATKEKLRQYGIAPPGDESATQGAPGESVISFVPYKPACPRCGSKNTNRLSRFGATACKALYRCDACLEPFEYFKPI
jgi:ring-1,2-phenylacetyl-CoA epoxidase subunit PaaD